MLSSVCTFCTVCEFISCDSPVEKAKTVYNSSYTRLLSNLEQGTGVEPASAAWEAAVLPMYEPCMGIDIIADAARNCNPHFEMFSREDEKGFQIKY